MNGVIITDMEMPSDCFDCERRKKCCGDSCSIQNRKNDCPLKSVEGLIEKIESLKMISTNIVIGLIKEYCKGLE